MDIEGIRVAHALPGRVRLKVDRVKGNALLAREAQEKLAKVPGIRGVEAKADTGSLLIHYDPEELFSLGSLEILSLTLGEIFPEIEVASMAAWLTSLAEQAAPGAQPEAAAGAPGAWARLAPGGVDLRLLVPFTLVLFGARALLSSEKVGYPAWYDYLWFGFSTFVMLNRGLVEGGGAGAAAGAPPAAP
jgi:hypothetical protein